jgi:predicted O-methyltransferase YrrM
VGGYVNPKYRILVTVVCVANGKRFESSHYTIVAAVSRALREAQDVLEMMTMMYLTSWVARLLRLLSRRTRFHTSRLGHVAVLAGVVLFACPSCTMAWPFGILTDNALGSATANNVLSVAPITVHHDLGRHQESYIFPFDTDAKYFMKTCMARFAVKNASVDMQLQLCESKADALFEAWFGTAYFPGIHMDQTIRRGNHTADYLATRGTILALLAEKYRYKHYLEVGTAKNLIFTPAQQMFELAVGVDPGQGGTLRMTSDAFFDQNWKGSKQTFDLIFIDGLHEANQVYTDVMNALMVLNSGGTIVLHDCSPHGDLDERAVYPPPVNYKLWNGDTWKAIVALRLLHSDDLDVVVVEVDHGVGVVRRRPSTNRLSEEWIQTLHSSVPLADNYDSQGIGYIGSGDYARALMQKLTNERLHMSRTELLPLTTIDGMLEWLDL